MWRASLDVYNSLSGNVLAAIYRKSPIIDLKFYFCAAIRSGLVGVASTFVCWGVEPICNFIRACPPYVVNFILVLDGQG